MTVSHWQRSARPPRGPVLADELVIGAGVVGLSLALRLARRGRLVRVLERHAIGAGASTRNAGFLMRGCADHYADAVRSFGRERAALLWKWSEDNLAGLRSEGAESLATFQRTPSCLLALDDTQRAELLEARDLLRADGFAVEWIESDHDAAPDTVLARSIARGGLVNPADAAVNSADLIALLAHRCRDAGVTFHEGLEVFSIDDSAGPTGHHVEVRGVQDARAITPANTPASPADIPAPSPTIFRAERATLCTNAYTPALIPSLARVLTPRRGQMFAIHADNRRLDRSYYVNHGSEYFRQTTDGAIVVGGCRTYFADQELGTDDVTTPAVQSALHTFAERVLGGPLRITARWAGIMAFTPDGLPVVGPVHIGEATAAPAPSPQPTGRVWLVSACTGHGMSMGYRTAAAAADHMLGGPATPFPVARFTSS